MFIFSRAAGINHIFRVPEFLPLRQKLRHPKDIGRAKKYILKGRAYWPPRSVAWTRAKSGNLGMHCANSAVDVGNPKRIRMLARAESVAL